MNGEKVNIFFIIIFTATSLIVAAIGYIIWFEISMIGALIAIIAPVVATYVVYLVSKKEIKPNIKCTSFKEISIGIVIPIIYLTISFFIMLLINNKLQNYKITKEFFIILCAQWLFGGFCEEIGWRGILLPLLKNTLNYYQACLVDAFIWFIWHVPLILAGQMMGKFGRIEGLSLFLLEVISLTFIMGAISETKYGKSIWPFVFLHATHNILVAIIVPFLSGNQLKLVNDGGYIVNVIILVFAILSNYFIVYKNKKINEED